VSLKDFVLKAPLELINKYTLSHPLIGLIGLQFVEIREGFARAVFPHRKEVERSGGVVHGGVVATVLDHVIGTAVMTVNDGKDQVTLELKVNFLEPLRNGPYVVLGRVVRRGRRVVVGEGELYDGEGKLCAKALGTWYLFEE